MASNNNHLTVAILTPGGLVYENQEVKVVVAPAALGEVAILPRHAPLFTRLNAGEVTVTPKEGQSQTFAVFGGFMDVNPEGEITILADFARRSHEIDLAQAQKAKAEAEKLMEQKQLAGEDEFARIETVLKQALFSIKIAEKLKQRHPH
jgi:F-type H+-transporting ATPase subunit epsilon